MCVALCRQSRTREKMDDRRRFEYSCDREGIEFTKDPEAGLRALVSLYRMTGSPSRCNWLVELFLTHPSLINRLEAIARAGDIPISHISAILVESGFGTLPPEAQARIVTD